MAILKDREEATKELQRPVLLLNGDAPVKVITWQKAVTLLLTGRATEPWNFDDYYDILTSSGEMFQLPTAIVLVEYAYIPYKDVPLTRKNVLKRDKYECQYCGKSLDSKSATIDHIVPRHRGGRDSWKNLVACCRKCNTTKGHRSVKDMGYTLRSKPSRPTREVLVLTALDRNGREQWKRWIALEDVKYDS